MEEQTSKSLRSSNLMTVGMARPIALMKTASHNISDIYMVSDCHSQCPAISVSKLATEERTPESVCSSSLISIGMASPIVPRKWPSHFVSGV
jgi:hypothetical protein